MKVNLINLHNSFDLELKPYYSQYPMEVIGLLTGLIQKILHSVEDIDPRLDTMVSNIGLDETISAFQKGLHRVEEMCLKR
jgi:hypothetical protein